MRPPCEIAQKDYLPAVRSGVARLLRESGLSQNEIARRMDVTQAAVSKYLSSSHPERTLVATEPLAKAISRRILNDEPADAIVRDICSTCMGFRIGGTICTEHRRLVESLETANCQICTTLLGGGKPSLAGKAHVLDDMRRAIESMERSSVFHRLVPQVRANIVACEKDATTASEVAAIPGRITLVGGFARALMPPEFGASSHTAEILLWAKSNWVRVRACLCISGSPEVVRSCEKHGTKVLHVPRPAATADAIARQVRSRVGRFSASKTIGVHVPGGVGLEPILYILGASAQDLVRTACDIAEDL